MIISHATAIWRKRNTPVVSIHRYLVNKGYSLRFLHKVCILVKNKINQAYILCIYINVKKSANLKEKVQNLIYNFLLINFPD